MIPPAPDVVGFLPVIPDTCNEKLQPVCMWSLAVHLIWHPFSSLKALSENHKLRHRQNLVGEKWELSINILTCFENEGWQDKKKLLDWFHNFHEFAKVNSKQQIEAEQLVLLISFAIRHFELAITWKISTRTGSAKNELSHDRLRAWAERMTPQRLSHRPRSKRVKLHLKY